jgi:hypothetical protein
LAVVEVEVGVMIHEVVAKVLVVGVLVFLERVQVLQALVVVMVVAMAVSRVQVVHQPLRQLLSPLFPPLRHFPLIPLLFVPRPFPYISRVLWRVLLTVLEFLLDYPFVLLEEHIGVQASSFFIKA